MRLALALCCWLLALPIAALLVAWLGMDQAAWALLAQQAQTVLAGYAVQSFLLCAGVGLGVAVVGCATAALTALYRFRGRRVMELALLLPLAMPAYVMAYAYTDALQFSGPAQTALRQLLGTKGPLWPDVRSLPGAVALFVFSLYPYVHLLVRAALAERAPAQLEAARMLGAGPWRRLLQVSLPLARPAMAAGVALALMETLADYGVGSYFGLATFTTGIYKAWLAMGSAVAAAQLASLLLLVVAVLLWLERRAQARMRFAAGRATPSAGHRELPRLRGLPALGALLVCLVPVLIGFVLPLIFLLTMAWRGSAWEELGWPWQRFGQWAWASFKLATLAACMATALALALAYAVREGGAKNRWVRPAARMLSLGYAVPGAVVAMGILLPLAWLQARWPASGVGAVFTSTVLGLLFAYLVRFSSVALQSVQAGYARLPVQMDESARLLGAGSSRLFARVHWPLIRRSALAAGLLVFVDTMKELPATLALRPFGSDTLAVAAYNLARDERLAEAALPSLAIVLVGLAPVALLAKAIAADRPGRGHGAS